MTPPFAGYVSGHSTFSRAAAKVLTLLTGSEYFPGGIAEYQASKDEYLVFEEGPSETIVLQWAKYYDASDQCSLSRIWGGIHPPIDDIPGRLMGEVVGDKVFEKVKGYFNENRTPIDSASSSDFIMYPNPISVDGTLTIAFDGRSEFLLEKVQLFTFTGQFIKELTFNPLTNNSYQITGVNVAEGSYILKCSTAQESKAKFIVIR